MCCPENPLPNMGGVLISVSTEERPFSQVSLPISGRQAWASRGTLPLARRPGQATLGLCADPTAFLQQRSLSGELGPGARLHALHYRKHDLGQRPNWSCLAGGLDVFLFACEYTDNAQVSRSW